MIATNNGGRAKPKLRNRESLFARKTHYNGCVTSRNILFVVVDDNYDDNDDMSIKKKKKMKKGASVRRKESSGHAWKENSKFETRLFPRPRNTTYAIPSIPSRVRGQCSMTIRN